MSEEFENRVSVVIGAVLEREGTHELVELRVVRHGRSTRLQVFVDSDDGVTLSDCARLSRAIDCELEAQELFEGSYTIEVSSPGVDRPLATEKEFRRKLGRTIAIDFTDEERKQLRGTLKSVENGRIIIETKKSGEQSVALDEVSSAREYI